MVYSPRMTLVSSTMTISLSLTLKVEGKDSEMFDGCVRTPYKQDFLTRDSA